MIKELANYQGMGSIFSGKIQNLNKTLFCKNPKVHALLIKKDKKDKEIIGYIIYFYNYSTFTFNHGIYIEDIYIKKKYRALGFGTKTFQYICNHAINENCDHINWCCLHSNTKSLHFYKNLGASIDTQWLHHKLEKNEIEDIAHYHKLSHI